MITTLSWVPKGASKSVPEEAQLPSKEEIDELIKSGALKHEKSEDDHSEEEEDEEHEEDDENMDVDAAKHTDEISHALAVADALGKTSKSKTPGTKFHDITDGLKELDLDHYDDEDEGFELFSKGIGDLYYPSNKMDPYLKDGDDSDSEELEDMTINPNDAVIVCARTEDGVSVGHLEVYIYEESKDGDSNLYVHHHIIIPAVPLCTTWLDCPLKGGEKGNFMAVGSMEPSIEIWDLDIIDEVQPCVVLGGVVEEKDPKKKKKKKEKKSSNKYKEGSHTGSVLGLAWNKEFRNILASASADKQVKIWDITKEKCTITLEHHTKGVQAVAWNHHAPQVLLSGSCDRSVVLKDARISTQSGFKWSVTAKVESLAWDPHTEHSYVVSLKDGTVKGYDIRTANSDPTLESPASFILHAHDKAVCSVSYNPLAPNLLATGSMDKMVKLWDLSNNQPSCIASTNRKAGGVFSVSFSEDSPFLLAIGGSRGKLKLWDVLSDAGVSQRFNKYCKPNRAQLPLHQMEDDC